MSQRLGPSPLCQAPGSYHGSRSCPSSGYPALSETCYHPSQVPSSAQRSVTVHLGNNANRTIPMQVVNLSDNFVTFKMDYPLGSIEEVCGTLEDDEDSSSHGPKSSAPSPISPTSPGVKPFPEFDV